MLEEHRLNDVKKDLIAFASHVEGMIEKAVRGLQTQDRELLNEVCDEDEPRANDFELELDERCIELIALHQPMGPHLRTILMISNITSNLERMGDHAVTIAKAGRYLIEQPPVKPLIDTPEMARIVMGMLKDGITAFVNRDADLAWNVCERDSTVDDLRTGILRELIDYMRRDPQTIERSLRLMKIASNLERIADLTTNLCEDVIYMTRGKVIKHHKEDWD